jgi:hypothetical protein
MVTDIRVPTIENAGMTLYIGRWFKRVGIPSVPTSLWSKSIPTM